MQEKQHLFYVFYNMFFNISFTLLFSINNTKIGIYHLLRKHFTNYFAVNSYVLEHNYKAYHVRKSMNTNKTVNTNYMLPYKQHINTCHTFAY